MDRPRKDFPLSAGVRFPVARPTRYGAIRIDYEATLGELLTWLEGQLDLEATTTTTGDGYPPQLGHARI